MDIPVDGSTLCAPYPAAVVLLLPLPLLMATAVDPSLLTWSTRSSFAVYFEHACYPPCLALSSTTFHRLPVYRLFYAWAYLPTDLAFAFYVSYAYPAVLADWSLHLQPCTYVRGHPRLALMRFKLRSAYACFVCIRLLYGPQ